MTISESKTLRRRTLLRGASLFGGGLFMALNIERPLALAAMKNGTAATLDPGQWQTVAAMTGRIIPTDHQPGAIEANCVNFIDKTLDNEDSSSRADFIAGLAAMDAACEKSQGKPFVELSLTQQDLLLASLAGDTATPWPTTAPLASDFFELLRALTIMGFMADPKYGGNADMAGWRVARYPGPRHHQGGYTPAQMVGEEEIITMWGEKM
jgi:gluconate 2-dehydrogenase gamma chain